MGLACHYDNSLIEHSLFSAHKHQAFWGSFLQLLPCVSDLLMTPWTQLSGNQFLDIRSF